ITLLGLDRVIRARASKVENSPEAKGLSLPGERPFFDLKKPAMGVFRVSDIEDGIVRIGAYRRLQYYPLVVVVSLAEDEVYGDVNARRKSLTSVGLLVSTGLLVGLWMILWLDRQQQLLHLKLAENE